MTEVPRFRHAEHVMGTVVSIDLRGELAVARAAEAVRAVVGLLHHVDAVFSTYKDDSEISRLRRGELDPAAVSDEVRGVLALCEDAARVTGGWFSTAWDGLVDPTGLVKGWSADRAVELLAGLGITDAYINAGGDVRTAGHPAPGRSWRVGVADPRTPGAVAVVAEGTDLCVATSGTAERGAHVVDPHTGRPAEGLLSVTVVAADLARADAYATGALAMGPDAQAWATVTPGVEAFGIATDGGSWRTAGFPAG